MILRTTLRVAAFHGRVSRGGRKARNEVSHLRVASCQEPRLESRGSICSQHEPLVPSPQGQSTVAFTTLSGKGKGREGSIQLNLPFQPTSIPSGSRIKVEDEAYFSNYKGRNVQGARRSASSAAAAAAERHEEERGRSFGHTDWVPLQRSPQAPAPVRKSRELSMREEEPWREGPRPDVAVTQRQDLHRTQEALQTTIDTSRRPIFRLRISPTRRIARRLAALSEIPTADDPSSALSLLGALVQEAALYQRRTDEPISKAEQLVAQGVSTLLWSQVFFSLSTNRAQESSSNLLFRRSQRTVVIELLLILDVHAQLGGPSPQARFEHLERILNRVPALPRAVWESVVEFAVDRGCKEDALQILRAALRGDTGRYRAFFERMHEAVQSEGNPAPTNLGAERKPSAKTSNARTMSMQLLESVRERDVDATSSTLKEAILKSLQKNDLKSTRDLIIEGCAVYPDFEEVLNQGLLPALLQGLSQDERRAFIKFARRAQFQHDQYLKNGHRPASGKRYLMPGRTRPRQRDPSSREGDSVTQQPSDIDGLLTNPEYQPGIHARIDDDWVDDPPSLDKESNDSLPSFVHWMQEASTLESGEKDETMAAMYALQIRHLTLGKRDYSSAEQLLESLLSISQQQHHQHSNVQQNGAVDLIDALGHVSPFIEALCAQGKRTDAMRVKTKALEVLGLKDISIRAHAALIAAHVLAGRERAAYHEMRDLQMQYVRPGQASPCGGVHRFFIHLVRQFCERWQAARGVMTVGHAQHRRGISRLTEPQQSLLSRLRALMHAYDARGLRSPALVQQEMAFLLRSHDYLRAEEYLSDALRAGLVADQPLAELSKKSGSMIRKLLKRAKPRRAVYLSVSRLAAEMVQDKELDLGNKEEEEEGRGEGTPEGHTPDRGDLEAEAIARAMNRAIELHRANRKMIKDQLYPRFAATGDSAGEHASSATEPSLAPPPLMTPSEERIKRRDMLRLVIDWREGHLLRQAKARRRESRLV